MKNWTGVDPPVLKNIFKLGKVLVVSHSGLVVCGWNVAISVPKYQ